jgi:hypothetical protein
MDTGEVGIDNIVAAVAAGALRPFLGGISEADDDVFARTCNGNRCLRQPSKTKTSWHRRTSMHLVGS